MHDVRLLFAYCPEITQLLARMLVSHQHCELLYLLDMLNCMYDVGSQIQTSMPPSSSSIPSSTSASISAGMASHPAHAHTHYVYRRESVISALVDVQEGEVMRRFVESRQDKVFSHADWQVSVLLSLCMYAF
ncbi:hypothetical protein EON63_22010 [archaeon]|nr:MAG: hypothetical protein EON63_22010 [archaeon]